MKNKRQYDFPNATIIIFPDGTCREFPKWCQMISVARPRKWVVEALLQLRKFRIKGAL